MSGEALEDIVIKQRLAGLSDLTFAFPNENAPGVTPYVAISIDRLLHSDKTLAATSPVTRYRIVAAVITDFGRGSKAATETAERIGALFPMGLRVSMGSKVATVIRPPNIQGGYRDGPNWRLPVIVDLDVS